MSNEREQRGQDIAKVAVLARKPDGSWLVPSMSGNGRYSVKMDSEKPTCTCPDCENGHKCKHIFAVEIMLKRETTHNADGSTTVTETVAFTATKKKTYPQNWPAYNEAQTTEKDHFQTLLHDLCKDIQTPAPKSAKGGRPSLPLSDAVFSAVFKVYSTFSGRRFISDLRSANEDGLISKLPHFNSIFNYLENPEVTPILKALIEESAKPLAAVETDFAADSSGFATSRFVRWFDVKYGVFRADHDWVKVHLMCGVKTNIVTAVEIDGKWTQDIPMLPAMLDTTAKNFKMSEVSADKGYLSVGTLEKIVEKGAMPFVPFKSNSSLNKQTSLLWKKMFHFFHFKQDEFMAHYHKRSNVESTFSMIKAKFGDCVRSKTAIAMKNEALCKILCHNICCLISAMYELGITPAV